MYAELSTAAELVSRGDTTLANSYLFPHHWEFMYAPSAGAFYWFSHHQTPLIQALIAIYVFYIYSPLHSNAQELAADSITRGAASIIRLYWLTDDIMLSLYATRFLNWMIYTDLKRRPGRYEPSFHGLISLDATVIAWGRRLLWVSHTCRFHI